MQHEQLDYLDEVIADVLDGNYFRTAGLSTGQRLYVALGASDIAWLREMGCTVAQALGRLDYGDASELVKRWRHVDRWAKRL